MKSLLILNWNHLLKFPLRKTPTFIGNDGFQLTETIAIGIYFLSMITNHDLLGDNDQEFASIIRFLSMLNQEGAMSWVGAFSDYQEDYLIIKKLLMRI